MLLRSMTVIRRCTPVLIVESATLENEREIDVMTRIEEAEKRVWDAQVELEAARTESHRYPNKRVFDAQIEHKAAERTELYRTAYGGGPNVGPDRMHERIVTDGESLVVETDAEEVTIIAGPGCSIDLAGDIGIVRIEAGDGSIINFEDHIGGANVHQGNGSSTTFFETPETVTIEQGAGSEVTNMPTDKLNELPCNNKASCDPATRFKR